jgi:hypothetical protein
MLMVTIGRQASRLVLFTTLLCALMVTPASCAGTSGGASPQNPQPIVARDVRPETTAAPADRCASARITAPSGARNRHDGAAYPVTTTVTIEWKPSECILTVDYYQGDQLQKSYKNLRSGQEFTIRSSDSGETEITVRKEGEKTPADAIWVMVK